VKIAVVPVDLLRKAGRMDADFFIGNQAEKKIARALQAIAFAKKRLAKAKKELKQRDRQQRKLGITGLHDP